MDFSIFPELYSHYHNQFRTFSSSQKAPYPLAVILRVFFPHPWWLLIYFLSIGVPILDISYTWNHMLCGLLCLASFTKHSVFKVHPHWSMSQHCIPFYGQIIFHCIYLHILLVHSSVNGHLGCFHFWAITNSAAMHIRVQLSVWTYVFNFLGCMSGSPIPLLGSVIHQEGT